MQIEYTVKQLEALNKLSRFDDCQMLVFGAAASTGKSFLGCDWQLKRRLRYPGTRGVIGRAELKRLQLSTMKTFWEVCGLYGLKPSIHYTYNGQLNILKFYNGSEIILMDMADMPSDPQFQRFGSMEITDYFVDEVGEISKRAIDILDSRVRFKLVNNRPKGFLTCNPTKGWLYNDVYLPAKQGLLPPHVSFIQALPSDNPHTDPVYMDKLNRLPEYDRQRLLFGNWEYDDDADALFKTDDLARCFRNEIDDKAPTYITADIARFGKDRTVILVWRGLTVVDCKILHRADTQEVGQQIRDLIKRYEVKLSNVIADEDGMGGGVVDFVKCRGFMNGSKAPHPERFTNLKAECYYQLALEIERGNIVFMAGERNQIIKELEMIKRHRSNTDQKLSVTPKDQIKNTYGISPDIADAIMMRMYWVVSATRGVYAVN
jgi:hypothetical protein